jgi:ribosomal protein S18 acetylase RimI-like enzyme
MQKFTNFTKDNINVNCLNLDSELIFITENNKQVGSLIMCYNNGKANVFSVAVLEKFRGKGYGKKLTEAAINRAKERGCSLLELNTEVGNTVANSLYTKLGFELQGLLDDYNNYTISFS